MARSMVAGLANAPVIWWGAGLMVATLAGLWVEIVFHDRRLVPGLLSVVVAEAGGR